MRIKGDGAVRGVSTAGHPGALGTEGQRKMTERQQYED